MPEFDNINTNGNNKPIIELDTNSNPTDTNVRLDVNGNPIDDVKLDINGNPVSLTTPTKIEAELSASILAKFGQEYKSTKVDDFGNLLDEKGTIVAKVEDLYKRLEDEETSITIDSVKYNLDKDGNAIDSTGKIVKTKEQINNSNPSLIKSLEEKTNIKVYDQNNNVISFPDDIEGIAKRELYIASQHRDLGKREGLNEFFKQEPDIYKAFIYLKRHNTLEGFNKPTNWDTFKLEDDNVEQHKDIIIKSQILKGNSEAVAKDFAQYGIDSKKSLDLAKDGIEYIKGLEKQEEEQIANQIAQQKELDDRQELEYYNKYKEFVNTQKMVKGIPINDVITINVNNKPETLTKDDFLRYKFEPRYKDNNTGETFTQLEYDKLQYNSNLENEIFTDYLMFIKQDISTLINSKFNTEKVKNIREKLKEYMSKGNSNFFNIPNNNNNNGAINQINIK